MNTEFNQRRLIWNECERRYEGLFKRPVTVKIPYHEDIDTKAIRAAIAASLKKTNWPEYIQNWHLEKIKFVATTQPSISDIMNNVNAPWCPTECKCKEIQQRLVNRGNTKPLDMIEGHLFFIGRDYYGPNAEAIR
jgi:hypothetical protein